LPAAYVPLAVVTDATFGSEETVIAYASTAAVSDEARVGATMANCSLVFEVNPVAIRSETCRDSADFGSAELVGNPKFTLRNGRPRKTRTATVPTAGDEKEAVVDRQAEAERRRQVDRVDRHVGDRADHEQTEERPCTRGHTLSATAGKG